MSETSFEIMQREPMCEYCWQLPASWWVITQVQGEEKRYAACTACKGEVEGGLHECDYTCEHDILRTGPVDPHDPLWLKSRLLERYGFARFIQWIEAGQPPLREENGVILWEPQGKENCQ